MSANQMFAPRAAQKELVVRECQQIVFAACELRPGARVNEQIASAAKVLGQPFKRVRRAWYGLGGPNILPELRRAWIASQAKQENTGARELRLLRQRIEDLERNAGGLDVSSADKACEPDPRSGVAPARHKVALG